MFFEAGSGQFDDCNAVCMHSGVMRQSLIDVTPFMPVSDFICEYCSCVIIPEEQAASSTESLENKQEEHQSQLKREKQRKLQLDDETLMVARDVRVLRQRRKTAQDEAAGAWKKVQEAVSARQRLEVRVEELKTLQRLSSMDKHHVEMYRAQLQEQVAAAKRQRDALQAQYNIRQARLQGNGADIDPEEELRHAATTSRAAHKAAQPDDKGGNGARRMSFGKAKDVNNNAGNADGNGGGEVVARKTSFGRSSGLTRVLSFGKKKKPAEGDGDDEGGGKSRSTSAASSLVRKISFGRKKA